MRLLLSHIKKIKFLLWGVFVLFSLTPCSAKETFFDSVEISFFKPFHKNRTTVSSFHCQSSVVERQNVQTECFAKVFDFLPEREENTIYPRFSMGKIGQKYRYWNFSTLPKYILFRRLKIHLS